MSKQRINSKFFKQWSSNMAHVLGFIVADGAVQKRKNRKDSYVMNITNKEREHLEKINKVMSSQYSLGFKSSGYNKKKDYSFIQVSNKEICKDLINLGVRPRKTYNLGPIKVPKKYFSNFVRGFFDGDGSVYIYKVNGTPQIKAAFVSCALPFLKELNRRLCTHLNISKKTVHQDLPKRNDQKLNRYYIDFYVDDCEKLTEFMYRNNPTLYLLRKRQVFEKWQFIKRRHYIKQNYPSKIGWRLNQKISA